MTDSNVTPDDLESDPVESASFCGDCVVYGADDFDDDRIVTVSIGKHRKWKRWHQTTHQTSISEMFADIANGGHAERGDKDVSLLFPGELSGARRICEAVTKLDLIMLDYETAGVTFDDVLDAVRSRDLTAMVWTSHSHDDDDPRIRLLLPLSESYVIDQPLSIERRKLHWRMTYDAVAESFVLPYDVTGGELNRAMYLPAHPRGRPWRMAANVGRCLTVPAVELPPEVIRPPREPYTGPVVGSLDIKKMIRRYGDRMDLVSYVRDIGWPVRFDSDEKLGIDCPRRYLPDGHSKGAQKSDTGCIVSTTPDGHAFIKCSHAHCSDIKTSELLALIVNSLDVDVCATLPSYIFETTNDH